MQSLFPSQSVFPNLLTLPKLIINYCKVILITRLFNPATNTMRRSKESSPISPSKLSSTSFRGFNHYHKYENLSLMSKLPGDSYEDLFRSKLVLNEPFISLEAKNLQEKYAELEKQIRDLYEEFKLHCIPAVKYKM